MFNRQTCGQLSRFLQHRCLTSFAPRRLPPAFVFDIDGVILRGKHVLEPARNAFRILHGDNPFKRKIPYIFLTNGGGMSEEQRCAELSNQLGFNVSPAQYIQSHTIMKSISHNYFGKPVLALGGKGDIIKKVVRGYGFDQVYTPHDILAWNPTVYPFHELNPEEHTSTVSAPLDFSSIKFHAILVCHDPRNWGMDIQIMCDILLGNGYMSGAALSSRARHKTDTASDIEIIFCNPDLLWKNEFEEPRLGPGGFKSAWNAVWTEVRGNREDPRVLQVGKPTEATYSFAKDVLNDVVKSYGWNINVTDKPRLTREDPLDPQNINNGQGTDKSLNVYMIGDNPDSDIIGANNANWKSILVHTGVYQPQERPIVEGNKKRLPSQRTPTFEAPDVEHAVRLAIEEELKEQN